MTVLPIRLIGDEVLRAKAEPVTDFDAELRTLIADLTAAETADVLGCSVGTVKSQAHDALLALRRGLGGAPVGEVLER